MATATLQPRSQAANFYPAVVDRIVQELGPSIRDLARRLHRFRSREGATVVLITGSRPGAGCTTTALAMARAAAKEQAVLVIAYQGFESKRDRRLETPMFRDDRLDLAILPRHMREIDPAELEALRDEFDLVIVDAGPADQLDERWAESADVAMVVCDSANKLAEDWARAWDRLEEAGTRVLGIIETFG